MKTVNITIREDGTPIVAIFYSPDEKIKAITKPEIKRIDHALRAAYRTERLSAINNRSQFA